MPGILFKAIKEHLKRIDEIEADVQHIERKIKDWQKQQTTCKKISEIPDVGMLTATVLVATMGEAESYRTLFL